MKRVVVAAGLISRRHEPNKFLMTKRLPDAHLGGLWEFPGGKVESGESPEQALVREIKEELDIIVQVDGVFATGHHVYDAKEVILLVYKATLLSGTVKPLEVADFCWLSAGEVIALPLPPADLPVVERIKQEYLGL